MSGPSEGAGAPAVARVRAKVQEAGPGYTGFLVLQRLLPNWVRFHPLVLTGRRTTHADAAGAEGIRWGTREDLARLPAPSDLERPLEERFASGERFCVLEEDGRVLAYVWYLLGPYAHEEFGLRFVLGPRQVWGSDGFVVRAGRGRGLGSRLFRTAPSLLAEEGGHDLVLSIVDRPNRNMTRLQRTTGAVKVADLMVLRLGNLILLRARHRGHARWHLGRGRIPLSVRGGSV